MGTVHFFNLSFLDLPDVEDEETMSDNDDDDDAGNGDDIPNQKGSHG